MSVSCFYPKKNFYIGPNKETGKGKYLYCSYNAHHIEKHNGEWKACFDEFISPSAEGVRTEYIEVGCNNCIACRLRKASTWANRMMMELESHSEDSCWFITLTYSPDGIEGKGKCSKYRNYPLVSGEYCGVETWSLDFDDLKHFWDRIRAQLNYFYKDSPFIPNFKYYACGEYGGNTYRPHYHAIVYGLPMEFLTKKKKYSEDRYKFIYRGASKNGFPQWESELINDLWSFGFVTFNKVEWKDCSYVARYTMKKEHIHNNEFYLNMGLVPEDSRRSTGEPIGLNFYLEHKDDIIDFDKMYIPEKGGVIPPKNFIDLLEKEEPEIVEKIKSKRKEFSLHQKELLMSRTSLTYLEVLKAMEKDFRNKTKSLNKRNFERKEK